MITALPPQVRDTAAALDHGASLVLQRHAHDLRALGATSTRTIDFMTGRDMAVATFPTTRDARLAEALVRDIVDGASLVMQSPPRKELPVDAPRMEELPPLIEQLDGVVDAVFLPNKGGHIISVAVRDAAAAAHLRLLLRDTVQDGRFGTGTLNVVVRPDGLGA